MRQRIVQVDNNINRTKNDRQICDVGNRAQHCQLRLFHDASFAGDLQESKSTSGGLLCIFGSHTFVALSWMCRVHSAVSHSAEPEWFTCKSQSVERCMCCEDAPSKMDVVLRRCVFECCVICLPYATDHAAILCPLEWARLCHVEAACFQFMRCHRIFC